jgi:hypothetical protein
MVEVILPSKALTLFRPGVEPRICVLLQGSAVTPLSRLCVQDRRSGHPVQERRDLVSCTRAKTNVSLPPGKRMKTCFG